jgi:hypothetical protein
MNTYVLTVFLDTSGTIALLLEFNQDVNLVEFKTVSNAERTTHVMLVIILEEFNGFQIIFILNV